MTIMAVVTTNKTQTEARTVSAVRNPATLLVNVPTKIQDPTEETEDLAWEEVSPDLASEATTTIMMTLMVEAKKDSVETMATRSNVRTMTQIRTPICKFSKCNNNINLLPRDPQLCHPNTTELALNTPVRLLVDNKMDGNEHMTI
jgi:hypothetical protein